MAIIVVLFTAVIIGNGAFMIQMQLLAFAQYNSVSTSFMDSSTATNGILLETPFILNNFKTQYLFVNANIACQNTIDVDPESTAFNKTSIRCIEEILKKCEPSNFYLLYGLGSMIVSIQGKGNGLCSILIVHEIEMGEKKFSCLIPLDKVANWSSWKNSNGLAAVDDILSFCSSLK
jgi:hypothetical protein